ncbi:Cell number regulator 7 [Psilocybe cubensis]|uniref:Cell number regulator 7 n=2 Tax=Psilocybe cubensis TaxID=181762 RepID=A0ACB8GRK0_PSICU|nr:Cell number regulator 7 [Psilocybe cubensis]KAH9478037.1 Cell number regulator 7 [Psilocybe cubensis]
MAYTQQPMANPGMQVHGGNRNANNVPVSSDGTRDWSHGLFDCCGDAGTCIVACCCPCITYGQVKRRYEHLHTKGYPDPERGGFCTSDCMIHGCISMFGFGWIMQMMNRSSIRGRYNIGGGGVGDCCSAFCCTPCELTQESREIELEENTCHKQG